MSWSQDVSVPDVLERSTADVGTCLFFICTIIQINYTFTVKSLMSIKMSKEFIKSTMFTKNVKPSSFLLLSYI